MPSGQAKHGAPIAERYVPAAQMRFDGEADGVVPRERLAVSEAAEGETVAVTFAWALEDESDASSKNPDRARRSCGSRRSRAGAWRMLGGSRFAAQSAAV